MLEPRFNKTQNLTLPPNWATTSTWRMPSPSYQTLLTPRLSPLPSLLSRPRSFVRNFNHSRFRGKRHVTKSTKHGTQTHHQKTLSRRSSTIGSRLTHKQHTTNNQSTFGLPTTGFPLHFKHQTSTMDSIIKQRTTTK
jgi:hypothetical protein